jgi:hypothetical protein
MKRFIAGNEQSQEEARAYYADTADARRVQARASRQAHRDTRNAKQAERTPDYRAAANRKSRIKLRNEGFEHYGKVCSCCGEANVKFLTFDHPENNGAAHKVELAGSYFNASSSTVIRALRRLGWPAGVVVVLCRNCNSGRQYNGGICPHKE